MALLTGKLKGEDGALCAITLTEVDSKNSVIYLTDSDNNYHFSVAPGTYRVTLTPAGQPPKTLGLMAVGEETADDSLEMVLSHLKPETVDMQVLAFLQEMVQRAAKAAEMAGQLVTSKALSLSNEIKTELAQVVKHDSLEAKKSADLALAAAEAAAGIKNITDEITEKFNSLAADSEQYKSIAANAQHNLDLLAEKAIALSEATDTINSVITEVQNNTLASQTAAAKATEINDSLTEKFNSLAADSERSQNTARQAEEQLNLLTEKTRDLSLAAESIHLINDEIQNTKLLAAAAELKATEINNSLAEKFDSLAAESERAQNTATHAEQQITLLAEKTSALALAADSIDLIKDKVQKNSEQIEFSKAALLSEVNNRMSSLEQVYTKIENLGTTQPVTIPGDNMNNAVTKNHYFFNSAAAGTTLNHPINNAASNKSWGNLWVMPRQTYPMQLFLNYENQLFSRVCSNGGWQPWWQIGGEPVPDGVGTYCLDFNYNLNGSPHPFTKTTLRGKPGTWMQVAFCNLRDLSEGRTNVEITLYLRVR